MTRDEAREALWALIEELLPGPTRIGARGRLRLATVDFAHAATIEAVDDVHARLRATKLETELSPGWTVADETREKNRGYPEREPDDWREE